LRVLPLAGRQLGPEGSGIESAIDSDVTLF
jgi:hypothetical protein